jgi:hypothetical protein
MANILPEAGLALPQEGALLVVLDPPVYRPQLVVPAEHVELLRAGDLLAEEIGDDLGEKGERLLLLLCVCEREMRYER